jgi:DNA-binding MarR family transcriptional regulator
MSEPPSVDDVVHVMRAEEAGLIERRQSADDGRVAHLRLTREGELRLARSFTDLGPE